MPFQPNFVGKDATGEETCMRCAYLIVKSLRVNGRTKQYFCGELTIEDAGGASPAASWEFDVASREPLGLLGAS